MLRLTEKPHALQTNRNHSNISSASQSALSRIRGLGEPNVTMRLQTPEGRVLLSVVRFLHLIFTQPQGNAKSAVIGTCLAYSMLCCCSPGQPGRMTAM